MTLRASIEGEEAGKLRQGKDEVPIRVRLDQSDLAALEYAVNENELPQTQGFFFGLSDGSEKSHDLDFIHKARDALASGKAVFYTSWW